MLYLIISNGAFLGRQKPPAFRRGLVVSCLKLDNLNVYRTQLAAVFGILFGFVGHFLTLVQGFVSFTNDGREMNKDILAAIIVRNEAIPFFRVKPLNCTVIHAPVPPLK
jgi:hypothetical protein